MGIQRAEIKACVCSWLSQIADESLGQRGYVRRTRSLKYVRNLEGCVQSIDVQLEHHPADRPSASAAIYPCFSVCMEDVNRVVHEMVGGQSDLFSGLTLAGPIEWTAPKGTSARWYIFQPASVPRAIRSMTKFLERWTLPYLDAYSNATNLADAPAVRGDGGVANRLEEGLSVVAAKVVCGRIDEAKATLEDWFGSAGLRRDYHAIFEYVDGLGADPHV